MHLKRGVHRSTLLALAVLAWTSCGGSSGAGQADALGAGGAAGSDAAATGGIGGSSGSYGGSSGSYGGSSGTPGTCADPAYPHACPGLGDVPASCWSAGTDCSTVVKCGDQLRSCTMATNHYDCASDTCISATADDGGVGCEAPYPVSCPASGDVPKLCWSLHTVCSTIVRCGNDFKSCLAPGFHFDCTQNGCVSDSVTDARPSD